MTTFNKDEHYKALSYVLQLRFQRKIDTFIDYRTNEAVVKFGSVELRAPTEKFPTKEIYTQLLMVFG